MSIKHNEIAEFYKQLSLLVKSNLPIPEVLIQLSKTVKHRKFKQIIMELSNETAKGQDLSAVMKNYPQCFDLFHIELIEVGERSGTLAQVLHELSEIARIQNRLIVMLKDLLFYPFLFSIIAFIILGVILTYIIPEFKQIYEELLEGEPLPHLTQTVINVSSFFQDYFIPICSLVVAIMFSFIYIFSDHVYSHRILISCIRFLPYTCSIFYNLEMARICMIWSVLQKENIPSSRIFSLIAMLSKYQKVKDALTRVGEGCQKGENLCDVINKERDLSTVLLLTIEHTPEENLPNKLSDLSDYFKERAFFGFRKFGIACETSATLSMAVTASLIVLVLFIPIIQHIS